jgi:hypothetical protein
MAQLHYPRLYLLIDDWSCFEIDLEVIRGRVYPKLFEVTLKDIEGTLNEFAQKGLLFTWCIQGKTYGYFTGDEPGRLPAPKRRHKRQTPIPPQEKILSYMEKFNALNGLEGTLKPLEGVLKPLEGLHTPNLNPNPNLNPSKDKIIPTSASSRTKVRSKPTYRINLNFEKKCWEGITEEDKALWKKTYTACDIDLVLQEMIAFWDANRQRAKLNWKRAIVNRLSFLQDYRGTRGGAKEDRHKAAREGTLKQFKDGEITYEEIVEISKKYNEPLLLEEAEKIRGAKK